jgi:creatinine amidohydrolase/Fe(II)-dependent formamide hydrolase-like protein
MRFELMLPHQIRDVISRKVPVVLPLGVLEYHGEHMAVGMDTLAVTKMVERLQQEKEIVVLPPFYYGAASYAVEPPEGNGSVHVDARALSPFAEELFTGLLRVGFRNIHGIIHHQSENFAAGMPTDLAFRFGARQAIFHFIEKTRGDGWWGKSDMVNYYADHQSGSDPFNWIKIHPLMSKEITTNYPFDHAGIGETSLMLALCPEVVEMQRVSENRSWYTETAAEASKELGERGAAAILQRLKAIIT